MIGFGRFDESLEEEPDLEPDDNQNMHVFGAVSKDVDVFGAKTTCGRCAKGFKGKLEQY